MQSPYLDSKLEIANTLNILFL